MNARDVADYYLTFSGHRPAKRAAVLDALTAEVTAAAYRAAADDYERDQAEAHPGPIFGAIRRIRAYRVGAFLRARADEMEQQ